jgi:hypothetical protein
MSSLPTTPLAADSLEQLDWMSGAWLEDTAQRRCEEIWSTVDAHNLMGMFRWISFDDVSFYEFMVIKVTDAGAELHVKHFHPTLVAWEEKERFQAFILTEIEDNRAVFAAIQDPDESEVTGGWLTYELTDGNHLEVCIIEASGNVKLNFHFIRET